MGIDVASGFAHSVWNQQAEMAMQSVKYSSICWIWRVKSGSYLDLAICSSVSDNICQQCTLLSGRTTTLEPPETDGKQAFPFVTAANTTG